MNKKDEFPLGIPALARNADKRDGGMIKDC